MEPYRAKFTESWRLPYVANEDDPLDEKYALRQLKEIEVMACGAMMR